MPLGPFCAPAAPNSTDSLAALPKPQDAWPTPFLHAGEAAETTAQVASDTTAAAQQKAADTAAAAQVGVGAASGWAE